MNENVKLKITDLTWTGGNQVKTGTPVVFTITLKNEGTEDMVEGLQYTTLLLHVDTNAPEWIEYSGGLKVGESKTFQTKKPWEAVVGNHTITATLNFANPSPTTWESGTVFVKYLRVADEALAVPPIAAEAGMNTLTFSDDFTSLDTIDVNATGRVGYHWYVERPYNATNVMPDDYELTENGILLKLKKSTYNYGLAMVDCRTGAGWGFKHGYMECRFKVASNRTIPDTKGSPAIWAMQVDRYWQFANHWLEVDFLEYWGNKFNESGDRQLYTITMHEQTYEYGGGLKNPDHPFLKDQGVNTITQWIKNEKSMYHFGLGDDDWHTMGWLWEEGSFTTYLDGKCVMKQQWGKEFLHGKPELKVVTGDWGENPFCFVDNYTLPVAISGAYGWPMEVDYLQVWQK